MNDLSFRTPRLDAQDRALFAQQSVTANLKRARSISILLMIQSLLYLLMAYIVYDAESVTARLLGVAGSVDTLLVMLFGVPTIIILLARYYPESRFMQWFVLFMTLVYAITLSLMARDSIYLMPSS